MSNGRTPKGAQLVAIQLTAFQIEALRLIMESTPHSLTVIEREVWQALPADA